MAQRLWSFLDTVLIVIAGTILVAAILHVTADVASKYFLSRPIPGTLVWVSNFYMTAIVFLPLASAELRNQHIVVDLWPTTAPDWVNSLNMRFSWAFSSVIYFMLAWNTLKDAMRKQAEGEYVLDQSGLVTTWPSYYILPVGLSLVAVLLAMKIFRPEITLMPNEIQTND